MAGQPIYFHPQDDLSLIMLPGSEAAGGNTCTFQLYFSAADSQQYSLNDLNNYAGLLTLDRESGQYYYTAGNRAMTADEILAIIEHLKNQNK
jgi:hypothetical protein